MNLLDNWDFTNPVNQRGIAVNSKQTAIGYFIDRWINAVSTGYKITAQGLQLYANSDIYQVIDKNLLGQNVTLSIRLSNNSIISASFEAFLSVPTSHSFKIKTINNIDFVFGALDTGNFQVSIKPQVNILITAVKLEKGEVSTLNNDALGVSYAEELRKCQRYYRKLNHIYFTGVGYVNGQVRSNSISFEGMRIIPTVTITSDGIRNHGGLYFFGYGVTVSLGISEKNYINAIFKNPIIGTDQGNFLSFRSYVKVIDAYGNEISSPDNLLTFGTEALDIELSADL